MSQYGQALQDTAGLIDSVPQIAALVDDLYGLSTARPALFIDVEGVDLSRHGSVSILQILTLPDSRTYLIDVHILQGKAFETPGRNGRTLRDILESKCIPKVFFDVRNDSDALYSHFNVNLGCVHDLQLMEFASRTFSKRFLTGLSKCIEKDAPMSFAQRSGWKATKQEGLHLFAPEHGGTYEVFNTRPLPTKIQQYCVQDVQFLPRLYNYYKARLSEAKLARVLQLSVERVALSQTVAYNGRGRHMALLPTGL
ncbi:ribonuclease H-like domain-containing protein [Coniella lustricola]|uniref:Ribonuclease H-like domain-containing protein n=1 Tax=Coniella lustricola TaxID=2025994 RepID=A0A2T2ZZT5_9PEZI|nr:ribonuclease H-like domain-containing protein [Coniella lustricola]